MAVRDHDWSDDALAGRGGWKATERYTCTRCGLERRINFAVDGNAKRKGAGWIYFGNAKRFDADPGCRA